MICLDEIQRKPELFPLLRSLVDEWAENGHFLILGSASQDLLKQSSETLAGRISFLKLTPFLYEEVKQDFTIENYLVKGGFPRSLLAPNIEISVQWRENFISTFVERDLMQWYKISTQSIRRLWQMLSHYNGQIVNYSSLGNSLGISNTTVRNYIDLLADTYMLEIIPPYVPNSKKRVIKSPKIYLNDSGLINIFLGIFSFNNLIGHPAFGAVWETLVLTHLKAKFPFHRIYFYRTSHGAEIDFVMEYGSKILAIECKSSLSPKLSRGTYSSMADIGVNQMLVVSPVEKAYRLKENVMVVSVAEAIDFIREYFDSPV